MDLHIQMLFETEKTDSKKLWNAAQKQFTGKEFTYFYNSVIAITDLRLANGHNLENHCTRSKTLQHQLVTPKSKLPVKEYNSLFIERLGSEFEYGSHSIRQILQQILLS
jgi:hypothetical protein